MEVVPDRRATTLLPIIQQHVLPGTTVHSDEWSTYRQVDRLSNVQQHHAMNHSVTFVAPTAVHTQSVELYWNCSKIKLKRVKGVSAKQLPSYLDEFM